jgi:radical SAM protein (TIGR04043 family)
MNHSEAVRLKVELQAAGVRIEPGSIGGTGARDGGAGPAEGITLFIRDLVATVPVGALFVARSPFTLGDADATVPGLRLRREGVEVGRFRLAPEPEFYSRFTSDSVPMKQVALRHGFKAIGSTVVQACARNDDACRFCGIALSRKSGATVARKTPAQLAEVSVLALQEGFSHFVLTTGTVNFDDCGISALEPCARAIKEATGGRMKVHVQFEPPSDEAWIGKVAEVADSAAINIECFDEPTLCRVAPGKAAAGLKRYEAAWSLAVESFGEGQVTSFIIAGLGESRQSVLDGCELLCSMGVFPFVVPLRPIPGTPLGSASPPGAEVMMNLFRDATRIIERHGLSADTCAAGCVRCGACSAIGDFLTRRG